MAVDFEQVAIKKRVAWTLGVGFAGFFIGGKGGGGGGGIVGLAWGASIGYGFGSIFSQTRATKKLIAYWAGTLGLVGPLFSIISGAPPYPSYFQLAVLGAIGAGIGICWAFSSDLWISSAFAERHGFTGVTRLHKRDVETEIVPGAQVPLQPPSRLNWWLKNAPRLSSRAKRGICFFANSKPKQIPRAQPALGMRTNWVFPQPLKPATLK